MAHRYAVKIAGRERVIELREGADGVLTILVDGERRGIDAREVEPGVWSLVVDGQQAIAQVDGALPKLTIEIGRGGDPVIVAAEVGAEQGPVLIG